MEISEEKLSRANDWLRGNASTQYDINGAAQSLRELSDSFKDDKRDDRDILMSFETNAKKMGLSFGNMTKDQQLAVINAAGREGPCYNAFISNSSYQVLTLARAGEDAEAVADGFSGQDLTRISNFVRVFGSSETEEFSDKLGEIRDRVLAEEKAQELGATDCFTSSDSTPDFVE